MNHDYYCLHTFVQRLPRPQFICMKRLAINANGNAITIYIYIYIHTDGKKLEINPTVYKRAEMKKENTRFSNVDFIY